MEDFCCAKGMFLGCTMVNMGFDLEPARPAAKGSISKVRSHRYIRPHGFTLVNLQPKSLADWLLVIQSQLLHKANNKQDKLLQLSLCLGKGRVT
eukprot:1155308-Pelagomonas_calceolata.AAC.1